MYTEKAITNELLKHVFPAFVRFIKQKHEFVNHSQIKGEFYTLIRRYLPSMIKQAGSYGYYFSDNLCEIEIDKGIILSIKFKKLMSHGSLSEEGVDIFNNTALRFDFYGHYISEEVDYFISEIEDFKIKNTQLRIRN